MTGPAGGSLMRSAWLSRRQPLRRRPGPIIASMSPTSPVHWRRISRWGIVGTNRTAMGQLNSKKRAQLPKSAFAYVDSRGRRRLPINDESHVRNALSRFNQVIFEDEAARERARTRLLNAAKKYGIVPVGFMTGQLQAQMSDPVAGRLVIELGQVGTPGAFERRPPPAPPRPP